MNDLVKRLRSQEDHEAAAEIERLTRERDAALVGAVGVKPLEWMFILAKRSDEDPELEETGDCEAQSPCGLYYISMGFGSDSYVFELLIDGVFAGSFDDPTLAKASAQADHEARVRAALEPAAPSVSAAEVKRKYRLLKDGERTMPGDQRLDDNCETWFALQGWEVGLSYDPSFFVPMRRALATKENSDE